MKEKDVQQRLPVLVDSTQIRRIEDWDTYFLEIAVAVSWKSKDPKCPVGAVVASSGDIVVSTGFNGYPRGDFDRDRLLVEEEEKLNWICHAEANAIFNAARAGTSLVGCKIYATKFPCLACCHAIIQAGIAEICTHDHRYWSDDPLDLADERLGLEQHDRKRTLLRASGVRVNAPFHPDWRIAVPLQPTPRVTWAEWNRASA